MTPLWVWLSLLALAAWTVQRLLSKVALTDLGTRKFYLLAAAVSLLTYAPYLALNPPGQRQLLPAFGLAILMSITFGVTTEALRRGPIGAVSPLTALGPAVTALLSIAVLRERLPDLGYVGLALAPVGVALLSAGSGDHRHDAAGGWLLLSVLSLALQGVGAFIAKLVVTPAGPSPLLLTSGGVQILVGLALAPPQRWRPEELRRRAALFTIAAYAVGGAATIGYLSALSSGPAAAVVPLVSTSPALAGAIGIIILREPAGLRRVAGIVLALGGTVLLSLTG